MEKEQLEKKFYCGLKVLDISLNTYNQFESIQDIEKLKNPVYPDVVNFFASSKFDLIDMSFPDAITDMKTKAKHFHVL
jgi:hypothetical protein